MLDESGQVRAWNSKMRTSRKPHPIVQVVESAASELNDLLNAIGLRIALLRSQPEVSPHEEAEMARLAGLIEKATQRVQRLQAYTRAEELVALMRKSRAKKVEASGSEAPQFLGEERQRTALLITDASFDDSAIRECLERSGCSVVEAKSSADGLKMLQANADFDHIVCDSAFIAEAGWKFTAELSRAAPDSRVYVLHRPLLSDRITKAAE
jgi:CheY-like chemotaxis protein